MGKEIKGNMEPSPAQEGTEYSKSLQVSRRQGKSSQTVLKTRKKPSTLKRPLREKEASTG